LPGHRGGQEPVTVRPELEAIPNAEQITRGDLAAIIADRLVLPSSLAATARQEVVTDTRGHWAADANHPGSTGGSGRAVRTTTRSSPGPGSAGGSGVRGKPARGAVAARGPPCRGRCRGAAGHCRHGAQSSGLPGGLACAGRGGDVARGRAGSIRPERSPGAKPARRWERRAAARRASGRAAVASQPCSSLPSPTS
jgi:hypothetical protein